MFAFIGGKKRPKKTLEGAIRALSDGYEGEKAIYNTETGEIFSLSGEPTILLTPSQYTLIKQILGICSLSTAPDFTFPKKTVGDMIPKLGSKLAKEAVLSARDIFLDLRRRHGNRESGGTDAP
jgi:hypothetical protein